MTTQAELLKIAKRYPADVAVRLLVDTITASKVNAEAAMSMLENSIKNARRGLKNEPGYSVATEPDLLIGNAAKATIAMSLLSEMYMSLACLLQAHGEQIEY